MTAPTNRIIVGDARAVLSRLPHESVHCAITSPPYRSLRDYGDDPNIIGQELYFNEYRDKLLATFRQLRRVLRDDGTFWLNMGDFGRCDGLSCAPWRIALAMKEDDWYLQGVVIWHKPNQIPSGTTRAPISDHEYIFMFTKTLHHYYDGEAIREPGVTTPTRLKRTVWSIPTQPFKGFHYAAFPEALVEPCIKAGTSEQGCCSICGKPWVRQVEKTRYPTRPGKDTKVAGKSSKEVGNRDPLRHVTETKTVGWEAGCSCVTGIGDFHDNDLVCTLHAPDAVPCTVLDPFMGSGTTNLVALRHGRSAIGIELNPEYAEMANKRVHDGLDHENFTTKVEYGDLP